MEGGTPAGERAGRRRDANVVQRQKRRESRGESQEGAGGGGCRAAQRGAGALVAHTKTPAPDTHAHTQACRGGGWTPCRCGGAWRRWSGGRRGGRGICLLCFQRGGHPRSKGRGTVGRQPSGRWNRQRADERHTHAPHERGGARPPHEAARDQRGRPSGEARWYCLSTRALRSPSPMIGGRGVNVPVRRGRPSGGVAWKTGLAASRGRGGGGRTSDQRWGCPYIPRARREALCAGAMAERSRGQCVCSLVWGGGCVGRHSKSSTMDRAQAGSEGKGRGRGTPPGRPSL